MRILDHLCKELLFDATVSGHLVKIISEEAKAQIQDLQLASEHLRHWSLADWGIEKDF